MSGRLEESTYASNRSDPLAPPPRARTCARNYRPTVALSEITDLMLHYPFVMLSRTKSID